MTLSQMYDGEGLSILPLFVVVVFFPTQKIDETLIRIEVFIGDALCLLIGLL